MEKISVETAVDHIDVSLDNASANYWLDDEDGLTWIVRGRNGKIEFEFVNSDDETVATQTFKLVEVNL